MRCAAFCWSRSGPLSPGCSRSSTTRSSSPKPSVPCWRSAFALAESRDEQLAKVLAPALERAAQASIRKDPSTLVGILHPLDGTGDSQVHRREP